MVCYALRAVFGGCALHTAAAAKPGSALRQLSYDHIQNPVFRAALAPRIYEGGGAPRSESIIAMIAGGNHTIIYGRAKRGRGVSVYHESEKMQPGKLLQSPANAGASPLINAGAEAAAPLRSINFN